MGIARWIVCSVGLKAFQSLLSQQSRKPILTVQLQRLQAKGKASSMLCEMSCEIGLLHGQSKMQMQKVWPVCQRVHHCAMTILGKDGTATDVVRPCLEILMWLLPCQSLRVRDVWRIQISRSWRQSDVTIPRLRMAGKFQCPNEFCLLIQPRRFVQRSLYSNS